MERNDRALAAMTLCAFITETHLDCGSPYVFRAPLALIEWGYGVVKVDLRPFSIVLRWSRETAHVGRIASVCFKFTKFPSKERRSGKRRWIIARRSGPSLEWIFYRAKKKSPKKYEFDNNNKKNEGFLRYFTTWNRNIIRTCQTINDRVWL